MKVLKKGEKASEQKKPVFKVVQCGNCRKRVAIQEGDGIFPCENRKDRCYVHCCSCRQKIVFKLRVEE